MTDKRQRPDRDLPWAAGETTCRSFVLSSGKTLPGLVLAAVPMSQLWACHFARLAQALQQRSKRIYCTRVEPHRKRQDHAFDARRKMAGEQDGMATFRLWAKWHVWVALRDSWVCCGSVHHPTAQASGARKGIKAAGRWHRVTVLHSSTEPAAGAVSQRATRA